MNINFILNSTTEVYYLLYSHLLQVLSVLLYFRIYYDTALTQYAMWHYSFF